MEREQLLKNAETFFCKAMATDSYASGAKAQDRTLSLGWKGYEFRDGDFKLEDMYFVSDYTKKSIGGAKIDFRGKMIWMTSYGGFYKKEVIPCLKAALLKNYSARIFNFGRGPDRFEYGGYSYRILGKGDFNRFSADEEIRALTGQKEVAGGHHVWGMTLI